MAELNLKRRNLNVKGSVEDSSAVTDGLNKEKQEKEKFLLGPRTSYSKQLLLLLTLALPWLLVLTLPLTSLRGAGHDPQKAFTIREITDSLYKSLSLDQAFDVESISIYSLKPRFWLCVVGLSPPHVFYYLVWTNSRSFYSFAQRKLHFLGEPFEAFAKIAHIIKAWQIFVVLLWYCTPEWLLETDTSAKVKAFMQLIYAIYPFQAILGMQLILLGQLFNWGVYAAIGEAGVYYGCRLGRKIPWAYGFPFDTVPHPQYLGATISIWGTSILFASAGSVENGLYGLACIMSCFYAFSSYVEQYF